MFERQILWFLPLMSFLGKYSHFHTSSEILNSNWSCKQIQKYYKYIYRPQNNIKIMQHSTSWMNLPQSNSYNISVQRIPRRRGLFASNSPWIIRAFRVTFWKSAQPTSCPVASQKPHWAKALLALPHFLKTLGSHQGVISGLALIDTTLGAAWSCGSKELPKACEPRWSCLSRN